MGKYDEGELNNLNLMVVALYCRYRKREDSWLSGFWARSVVGVAIVFLLLTLLEVGLVLYGHASLRKFITDAYLIIFFILWGISTFCVYRLSIPNDLLYKIYLPEEDYDKGNIIAFLFLFTALSICVSVMFYTDNM